MGGIQRVEVLPRRSYGHGASRDTTWSKAGANLVEELLDNSIEMVVRLPVVCPGDGELCGAGSERRARTAEVDGPIQSP